MLVACLGIATFAAMGGAMKDLALSLGAYNAMLWRTLVATCLAAVLFAWKGSGWPKPGVLKLHIWRGTVTSIMAFMFFWGLKYLPLAEAIALSFIAPLIALYLARLLLDEPIGPAAVIASLIGLSGALVIIVGKLQGDYGEEFASIDPRGASRRPGVTSRDIFSGMFPCRQTRHLANRPTRSKVGVWPN